MPRTRRAKRVRAERKPPDPVFEIKAATSSDQEMRACLNALSLIGRGMTNSATMTATP